MRLGQNSTAPKTLSLPLLQGGMGVGVSLGNLAGHVARAGGMGVISTANPGYREADFWRSPAEANRRALAAEIKRAKRLARGCGLVAVNVMVATSDWAQAVTTALEAGADAIISGAGLPLSLPQLAKGFDALLAPIVSSARAAAILCRSWLKNHARLPDFVVLEGSEAGGHLGFSAQELAQGTAKPLDVLLAEVRQAIAPFGNIPVFAAGGISTASEAAALMRKGAAGVQVATRFIATEECDASQAYKEILLRAKPEDIVITASPVGMPGRALRSPLVQRVQAGIRVPPLSCSHCIIPCKPASTPYCITRALIDAVNGSWETGLFFCGAQAAKLKEIVPVRTLIEELSAGLG